jgi:predicted nucleic acid-binding protein
VDSIPTGFLDSNIVIHAFARDTRSEECRQLLTAIREGAVAAILDPLVVHEITYSLPRYMKQISRTEVADHLQSLLLARGVLGDKPVISEALNLWRDNPGAGFVDCYLAVRASERSLPVFTMNVRHLRQLGADAPEPLPIG